MASLAIPPRAIGQPCNRRIFGIDVSAERRFLLDCAQARAGSTDLQLNWPELARLAEAHGMLPLLHRRLAQTGAEVPVATWQEISAAQEATVRQNLWLAGELIKVLEILSAAQVPALPYKGPVLAATAYGDLALRQFSDVDILLRPQDFVRAKAAVVAAGYTPGLELTPREEQAWIATSYEMAFARGELHNLIELQWALAPRFYCLGGSVAGLFGRARPVNVFGTEMLTLSPEDNLLVLAVHGSKHLWKQIRWLVDLARVAAQPLDWDVVLQRAAAWRIERLLRVSLLLMKELLGEMDFPKEAEAWLKKDSAASAIATELGRDVLRDTLPGPDSLAYFRRFTQLRERLRQPDFAEFGTRPIGNA